MDDEDDFIIEELIAATNSVERELGFVYQRGSSLIASQYTEPNESQEDAEIIFNDEPTQMPYFHCTGEDSSLSSFHDSSYVRNGFASVTFKENCRFETIFGLKISEYTISTSEVMPTMIQRARASIQILDIAVRDASKNIGSKQFQQSRLDVTSLLFVLWKLTKVNDVEETDVASGLNSLQNVFEPIFKNSILSFAHTAYSISGNNSKSPEYHLLHGYLEWRLLRLSILQNIFKYKPNNRRKIDEEFHNIIYDLIQLSYAKYKQLKRVDLLYRTPFICTCIKELWLSVQLVIEREFADDHTVENFFWMFFNSAMNMFYSNKDIHTTLPTGQPSLNWPDFSIWLLCSVAKLQGFSAQGLATGSQCLRIADNFEMLNAIIRDFIAEDPIEDALRTKLFVVIPIICEWWPPKTDILLVLWEYFHKKLNSSFFLYGSAPSSLAVVSGSVIEYLNNMRNSIEAMSVNPNDTSFSMFTYMFGRVLKKLAQSDKAQINKIFGRITSKFSAPKLMALNETGIFNLTTLFLTIGLTTHLKDTARILQTILLQMTLSKLPTNRQVTLVRGHVALIVLFSRHQIPTGPYIAKLLEQLGAINQDRVCLVTSKILVDGFVDIFSNSLSFSLGQQLLIGPWLVKYLSASQFSEHQRIIACINTIINKISSTRFSLTPDESNNAKDVLKQIYQVFVPYTLQTFSKNESSRDIAELAANLCLNGDLCQDSTFNIKSLLKQFTDINCVNVENLAAFLVTIITVDGEMLTDEALIIEKWIQCCMCSMNSNVDFKQLTNIVVSTNEFRSVFMADVSEILNSKEPLCHFFSQVGRMYETSDYHKRIEVSEKIHHYLSSFTLYASALLEVPENTVKVFSMISIIIFHCAPIVYIRGRNSCFFNTIMFKFVLPNHVLTGRPQEPHLITATHKVWHMFILGIEKLDFESDQHLITIMTNLVEKWIPQFKNMATKSNVAKPFITCLKQCQPAMSTFVFSKITNAFISLQRRQPHALAEMVLLIYSDILSDLIQQNSHNIEIILRCSCLVLIEHAMMIDDGAPTKNAIIDLFTNLNNCNAMSSSSTIRSILLSNLKLATDKHLAFFSNYYFRFITRLAQINAALINDLLDHLRNAIANVELMRGAGRDGNLRNFLHKLEQTVLSAQLVT